MHVDVVTFATSKSRRLTLSRSQMASARKLGAGENWELGVYWSFGFEGFNKVMKQGAQTSNWRCTALAVMKYWSMRSARVLDKCV